MTTVYVYRTHLWNNFCKSQYEKLQYDLGHECVFLLFDDTSHPFPLEDYNRLSKPTNKTSHNILTNFSECLLVNPLHRSNKEQVESQILLFHKLCPIDFEFMWLIEYDVFCDGNWKLLDSCLSMNHDFLATQVYVYHEKILWNYWFALYGPRRKKPLLQDRASGFFPLVRLSKKLIDCLQENIGHYSGFCEVYIPTLAKQKGLTIGNVPLEIIGDIFYYEPLKKNEIKIDIKNNDKLYHPVTSIDVFD
jgi:hypothetical protein